MFEWIKSVVTCDLNLVQAQASLVIFQQFLYLTQGFRANGIFYFFNKLESFGREHNRSFRWEHRRYNILETFKFFFLVLKIFRLVFDKWRYRIFIENSFFQQLFQQSIIIGDKRSLIIFLLKISFKVLMILNFSSINDQIMKASIIKGNSIPVNITINNNIIQTGIFKIDRSKTTFMKNRELKIRRFQVDGIKMTVQKVRLIKT